MLGRRGSYFEKNPEARRIYPLDQQKHTDHHLLNNQDFGRNSTTQLSLHHDPRRI